MDILEDLKLEVIGTLYTLSSDHLIAVCDFLKISGTEHENVLDKGRTFLISHIVRHVERDEVNELEDQGMSFLLNLKDKIAEIQLSIEIQPIIQNPVELRQPEGHVAQMSEQERLKKQIKALQLALQMSMLPKQSESKHEVQGVSQNDQTVQGVSARDLSQPLFWQREFKISGQIGEPGQRDKLSFSSLAHQIENGIKKNFPEHESACSHLTWYAATQLLRGQSKFDTAHIKEDTSFPLPGKGCDRTVQTAHGRSTRQ